MFMKIAVSPLCFNSSVSSESAQISFDLLKQKKESGKTEKGTGKTGQRSKGETETSTELRT